MPAPLFFPDHLSILADLKDSSATPHQNDLLTCRFFDLSRHTVGFRTVVSLLAVFDLDFHKEKVR